MAITSQREIRIALVGCGWISESHVAGYRALRQAGWHGARVVACCDLNRAAATARARDIAAFQGEEPAVFATVEELIAAGVAEAADICLPHCLHHSVAIRLLDAGLHVQVEKPLGITVRASRAIIAAATKAGRVLAVAENTRRSLGARAAVWALNQAKLIGEPVHASSQLVRDMSVDLADPKWAWRSLRLANGGGMLIDGGAHFADMAIRLFGQPVEIACRTRRLGPATPVKTPILGTMPADAEDWWHAVITFASGASIHWSASLAQGGSDQTESTWYGTQGALVDGSWPMHPFESGGRVTRADKTVIEPRALEELYLASLSAGERERLFPGGVRDSFAIEIADFARAVAEGGEPEIGGETALRAKTLCLACYESAQLGGAPVRYDDVLNGRIDAYQRPIDERWGLLATGTAKATA